MIGESIRQIWVNNICNNILQVVIEGVRGNGYKGDIAIDDVNIADGPCAGKIFSILLSRFRKTDVH